MIDAVLPPASPPLDPGVEQARSWLAHELASAAYVDDRSLYQRIVDWLQERLSGSGPQLDTPGWALPVVLVVLALVVVAILLVVVRRTPTVTRTAQARGVLDDPHLTADGYRARALAALERGDATAATADAFRAVAAASAERTLLDDVPGRTAHEIGAALAVVFPAASREVRGAADLFDRVVYGRAPVGLDDARSVLDLDSRLRSTRPVLPGTGTGNESGNESGSDPDRLSQHATGVGASTGGGS